MQFMESDDAPGIIDMDGQEAPDYFYGNQVVHSIEGNINVYHLLGRQNIVKMSVKGDRPLSLEAVEAGLAHPKKGFLHDQK
jgi:hypothetical protein